MKLTVVYWCQVVEIPHCLGAGYCLYFDTPSPHPLPRLLNSDELGIIFCKPPAKEAPAADPADSDDANAGATSSSEPHFILQEHKLGVSVHSVHPLINEARRAFLAAREDYTCARRGELGSDSTDQQGTGCGDVVAAARRLLSVTRALLLVNADHGSAWNARKALVRDEVHESINVRQEIKAGFFARWLVRRCLLCSSPSRLLWFSSALRVSFLCFFLRCVMCLSYVSCRCVI